jgi:hypothetical protein
MAAADLAEYISWPELECLNQQPSHPVTNVLKQGYREDDGLFLESDTDEQLLIHITFNQAVKLSSLVIRSHETKGKAPRRVRLFINRPSLGFSEAESEPAPQEIDLTDKELEGTPVQLRFVKFQNVTTLSIFVADNQEEEDTTVIQKIALYGTAGQSMNVADIKDMSKEQNQS